MKFTCEEIPVEKLIDYCDGQLQPDEAEKITKHIQECPDCKKMSEALTESLEIAQGIWHDDEVKWGDLQSFERFKISIRPVRKVASIAAGILLICGVSLFCILMQSNKETQIVDMMPTVDEIELEAERAAIAAQMLAVGDMYAAQAGAEEYAVQRYNDLIESFSGSPESEQAKLRLQELLERMVQ